MKELGTQLGTYLKSLRDAKGLTLRAVEETTGVSNAFLSQLESGKVKQPSPIVLYKLAQNYNVPYEMLMEYAGYPVPATSKNIKPENSPFHRVGPLTEEEEQSLIEYLIFLRSRSGRKKGSRR